ncbi:MAG: hypothetical protein HY954_00235 [Deltaproteobacteria bacterium]|nr:hypothetical protein [Deltaproteobacteria bacterium]
MKSPSSRITRVLAAILFAVLGILIILVSYQKQHWDTDIFWALKSGEWITSNLKVPFTDPFSYTFGGKPWVDFTWGFQVLTYFFFTWLGGWQGLFILQVILVTFTFIFLYRNLRHTAGDIWLVIPILYLVFVCSHTRLFIRPHLFEYFFVSLYLLLFTLYERKGKLLYLLALLPLQVIWVNVHSSAILGIFIAGAYAAGEVIDTIRRQGLKGDLSGKLKSMIGAAVALPAVSLINPYGPKLVIFPFIHHGVDNADAIKHIGEWTKPGLKELFFYLYPFPLDHFAFELLIIATVIALIINYRSLKARSIFLVAAGLYMAISHVRWIALFAYFAGPVLALNINDYLKSRGKKPHLLLPVLISLFLAFVMIFDFGKAFIGGSLGLGLEKGQYPEGTVAFMKKEGIKGNIYNEYIFGGYLIYEYPEAKVYIDGRTPTVYSPYFFWQSRLVNNPARWDRLVAELSIDMALIKLDSPFCKNLHLSPEWKAVSFDDISILFLKNTESHREAIGRHGMAFNACSDDPKYKLPEDREGLKSIRAELKRFISDSGGEPFARPHRLLGLVDSMLGGEYMEEAVTEFKKALSVIKSADTYYDMGVVLGKLKRQKESIDAFWSSIKCDKSYKNSYLALGLVSRDMKDHKEAICNLNKYVIMADDESDPFAYQALGMSYFDTSDFEPAVTYLKRAAFAIDDPKELGDIYYYIGNSLFETGGLDEGAYYYGKAIETKPEYKAVLKNLSDKFKGTAKGGALNEILK